MKELIEENNLLTTGAAVVERLRRFDEKILDDVLVNAPLVYNEKGRKALNDIFTEYIKIAETASIPVFLAAPTWRANKERVFATETDPLINAHVVQFMKELSLSLNVSVPVKIGGMIGCKNDCYKPEQSLKVFAAKEFHSWQLESLAAGGADFLIAETLPALDEAKGIALAMEEFDLPYIISFVIGKDGKILDGTPFLEAIEEIDSLTVKKPVCFLTNCSYPSFLNPAKQPPALFNRLKGIQANASSLTHDKLEGASELKAESVEEWGDLMVELNKKYGMKILGGCCGTNSEHLKYLIDHIC